MFLKWFFNDWLGFVLYCFLIGLKFWVYVINLVIEINGYEWLKLIVIKKVCVELYLYGVRYCVRLVYIDWLILFFGGK